jgi:hypothetical protein
MESSLCEKPERHASRRLSDHLTFEGQKQKVLSLVDKVYARKNLHLAWERVRANRGASGTDRITIEEFEANLEANLERLHRELRDDTYRYPARRMRSAGLAVNKQDPSNSGILKLGHFLMSFLRTPPQGDLTSARTLQSCRTRAGRNWSYFPAESTP